MNKSNCTFKPGLFLAVIIFLAFLMRLNGLDRFQMCGDEYSTYLTVQTIHKTGFPLLDSGYFFDAFILFDYFVAIFLKIFGLTVFNGRLFSVIADSISIFLTYHLGKEIFDARTGLLAASFLAFSSIQHDHARYLYNYAFLQMEGILFFYFFYKGYFQNHIKFIYLSTFVGLLLLWTNHLSLVYLAGFYLALIPQKRYKIILQKTLIPNLILLIVVTSAKLLSIRYPSFWSFVLNINITPRDAMLKYIQNPYMSFRKFLYYWRRFPIPFWIFHTDFISNIFLIFLFLNYKSQKKYLTVFWIPFLFSVIIFSFVIGNAYFRYFFIFLPLFALVSSDSFFALMDNFSSRISRVRSFKFNTNVATLLLFTTIYSFYFLACYQTKFLFPAYFTPNDRVFLHTLSILEKKIEKDDIIATDAALKVNYYLTKPDYEIRGGKWASNVIRKKGAGNISYNLGIPVVTSPEELYSITDGVKRRVWVILGGAFNNRYYGSLKTLLDLRFKKVFHKRDESINSENVVYLYDPGELQSN